MIPEISQNIDKIIDACKKFQLQSLYVFGSAARGTDFSTTSDVDLLYSLLKKENGLPKTDFDYFDITWELEKIIGKKIDLIPERRIRNKFFLQSITEDRIKIYEA